MTRIIAIDDPDDPRIAPYRNVRERDLVGRSGHFIAEGEVVLRVLARSPAAEAVSVLVADKRAAALAPVLAGFPEDVPVYAAAQPVLDAIAGFPMHRGILALGRRIASPAAAALLAAPGPALVLLLHGLSNHDNMGGVFRNAAAFGVRAVLLGADCCDPLYRKAIRVSVGAVLATPFAWLEPGDDGVDLLGRHGFEALALSPWGERTLAETSQPPRAAVLLGAEGPGLPAAVLARCRTLRIPMAAGWDSLNVATTSGVVLHHLTQAGP